MASGFVGVLILGVASLTATQDSSLTQEELVTLLKALYTEIGDIEFRYEGTKVVLETIDPKSVPEAFRSAYEREAKSGSRDMTYQGVFAYRADGAAHLDAYTRPSNRTIPLARQILSRVDSVFSRRSIVPDQGGVTGSEHSENASLSRFFNDFSPLTLFHFMWLRELLHNVRGIEYRFQRWEMIGERRCLVFDAFQADPATGIDRWSTRYWIDVERNGQPLKLELYDETFLKSAIFDVELAPFESDDKKTVWLPVKGMKRAFSHQKNSEGKPSVEQTFAVLRGSMLINQGLADDRFKLDWGLDAAIVAQAKKLAKSAGKPPIQSRKESSETLIKEALAKADAESEEIVAESPEGRSWMSWRVGRIALAGFGVAAIGVALYLKRRGR